MNSAHQSRPPHLTLASLEAWLFPAVYTAQATCLGVKSRRASQQAFYPAAKVYHARNSFRSHLPPCSCFGFCVVWRLDPRYVLCSPLKVTFDLQRPCSDEVQKCLIFFIIFSMTYQDPLMDTPGLCTEMPDFSCLCKIGRTSPSELALVFLGITSVFWIIFYVPSQSSRPGGWDLFPFSSFNWGSATPGSGWFRSSREHSVFLEKIAWFCRE